MSTNLQPLVSVITPAYNERNHIADCIRSVQMQSYPNIEMIVVDDGSTDGTQAIVRQLGIQLLEQAHQGPAVAKNLGVAHAKGDIIVFLDADEMMHPEYVDRMIAPVLEGRTIGTTQGQLLAPVDDIWCRCFNLYWGRAIDSNQAEVSIKNGRTSRIFRLILKAEFQKVGGFTNEGYSEDQSVARKLNMLAEIVPEAIIYHYNHDSFSEVFRGARWWGRGDRDWKSKVKRLIRTSLPVSLVGATVTTIRSRTPVFFFYKLIFDAAAFLGTLEGLLWPSRHYK